MTCNSRRRPMRPEVNRRSPGHADRRMSTAGRRASQPPFIALFRRALQGLGQHQAVAVNGHTLMATAGHINVASILASMPASHRDQCRAKRGAHR